MLQTFMTTDIHGDIEELHGIVERMILNAPSDAGELMGLFISSQIMQSMDGQRLRTVSIEDAETLWVDITIIMRSARDMHPDIEDFIVETAQGILDEIDRDVYGY